MKLIPKKRERERVKEKRRGAKNNVILYNTGTYKRPDLRDDRCINYRGHHRKKKKQTKKIKKQRECVQRVASGSRRENPFCDGEIKFSPITGA